MKTTRRVNHTVTETPRHLHSSLSAGNVNQVIAAQQQKRDAESKEAARHGETRKSSGPTEASASGADAETYIRSSSSSASDEDGTKHQDQS